MRVACVLATHLRAKVEMRRHSDLADYPVVIVDHDATGARPLVADRFPAASGVTAGMTLEQAVSCHANVVMLDADEPHYRRIFAQVLTSLQGISDRVEGADLGIAYVRVDGLEELFGGEAGVVSALLNAVPAYLNARIGVAGSKFPAFVVARTSRTLGATRVPGDVGAFLAPHSIDLLPVSPGVKSMMHRFGLHTMGAASSMSADIFVDQFGLEGKRAWALCNGVDDSPFVPMAFEESIVEHASLPFHSSSLEVLFIAVDTLLRRGYARPEMRGRYVGAASLRCGVSGSKPWEKIVGFREPASTWERASFSIRSRVGVDLPQAPVEDVTLTLSGLTGEPGFQAGLFDDPREDRLRRLLDVERRLRTRMSGPLKSPGGHVLHRIVDVAPFHPAPEMRALQVPVDPSGSDAIKPLHSPMPVDVREGMGSEPVSVRLRRRWHRVARIADKWTFDLWWLPEPVTRAYYRVDPGDGRQITLFRDRINGRWYRQRA